MANRKPLVTINGVTQQMPAADTVGPTDGGTGLATYTLGDLLYASASNTVAKLTGNTAATKKFLRMTGTGSAAAAPAWDTVAAADIAAALEDSAVAYGTGYRSTVRPSLENDFILQEYARYAAHKGLMKLSSFSDNFTFTRSAAANYCNALGVLASAGVDEWRIDHDPDTGECLGYLSEAGITQKILWSEDITNAYWTKTSGTGAATFSVDTTLTAPDGTLTGNKIIPDVTATVSPGVSRTTITASANVQHTFSVWLKDLGYSRARLQLQNNAGTNGAYLDVNLSDGTIATTTYGTASAVVGHIEYWRRFGWYRVALTVTVDAASTSLAAFVFALDPTGAYTWGSAPNGTSGIGVWGFSLLQEDHLSSYIKVTSVAVARIADSAVMTTLLADFYNSSECTVVVGYRTRGKLLNGRAMSLSDGTTSNSITVITASGAGAGGYAQATTGGASQAVVPSAATTTRYTKYRVAASFKANQAYGSRDGGAVGSDVSVTMPATPTTLRLGASETGGNSGSCHIQYLAIYPIALGSTELPKLSHL